MSASQTDTGRWIRQGRNVIVLLDSSQRPPRERSFAAEMAAWTHETEAPGTTQWVQSSLNRLLGLSLAVDGIVGPMTRAAIMEFQRREGLAPDGIVGSLTMAALQAALARQSPGGYVPAQPAGGAGTPAPAGRWTLAPGANRPGVPLTAAFMAFVDRMAGFYPGRLVLSTGTNHAEFVKKNGVPTTTRSSHWLGNAGDFGMRANNGTDNGPVGDLIATAAFMAAGKPRDEATRLAQIGGLHDVGRVQIIWKNFEGHHNHVHVGVRP